MQALYLYKVGYIRLPDDPETQHVLLVAMSDGMSNLHDSTEALCDYLNNHKHGFRPLSLSEVDAILPSGGHRFFN